MKFEAILLIFTTVLSLCFCRYAYTRLWDIGKKEKLYCAIVFAFTALILFVGWFIAIRQQII